MKGSDKEKVILNSLLYTMGNSLLKVFSFFLIPLYTSYLLPTEYGILNLATQFTTVLSAIVMLGLQFAVVRFYSELKYDKSKVVKLFGTIISTVTLTGIIIFIILFITYKFWVHIIFDKIPFFPIVLLALGNAVTGALYNLYQDILKGMQLAKKSTLATYVFFFLMLGFNILTVVVFGMGAKGILLATLTVNVIMIIWMIFDLKSKRLFKMVLDWALLKDLLKYSLPLLPHTLSYNIANFFTRVIINLKMSTSMLGIFSLSSQFGGVADVASNSVQSAFQPWMFSKLHEAKELKEDSHQVVIDIRRMTHMLLWLYGVIYLFIGSFSEEAVKLLASKEYFESWIYIPALVFAVAIKSPLYFYNNFLYYNKKKTKYIFYTTLISSVINISLTWLLVPVYGIFGSIFADIISMGARICLVIVIVKKEVEHIYSFIRLSILSLVPMFFLGISLLPSFFKVIDNWFFVILFKLFVISIYCLIIYRQYNKGFRTVFNRLKNKI